MKRKGKVKKKLTSVKKDVLDNLFFFVPETNFFLPSIRLKAFSPSQKMEKTLLSEKKRARFVKEKN